MEQAGLEAAVELLDDCIVVFVVGVVLEGLSRVVLLGELVGKVVVSLVGDARSLQRGPSHNGVDAWSGPPELPNRFVELGDLVDTIETYATADIGPQTGWGVRRL